MAALGAAILSYLLLINSKFKTVEKIILVLLMSFSAALLTYPLLLRMNEWTDDKGLQEYSYTMNDDRLWQADDQNLQLPKLEFEIKSSEYWNQFEIGTVKQFEIRKGGLGFYQLNMAPVYVDQRAFYAF